jgi:outer membrane protein assembly factor BamB
VTYREPPESNPIVVVARSGEVVGIERTTGSEVWRFDFWAPTKEPHAVVRLAASGDRVFASSAAGMLDTVHVLACLDYTTGQVRWSVRLADAIQALLVAGDQLFAAGRTFLFAVAAADGRVEWQKRLPEGFTLAALAVPGT